MVSLMAKRIRVDRDGSQNGTVANNLRIESSMPDLKVGGMIATSPVSQLLTSQNELLRDCDSQVEINQKLRSRSRTEVSEKSRSE